MRTIGTWRFGLIAAAALAMTGSAMAQGAFSYEGPYTQARSGAVFPVVLGGFSRVNLIQYDGAGHDVSATYRRDTPRGAIALTAYVYPAPRAKAVGERRSLCAAEFQASAGNIPARFANARPLREGSAPPTHDVPADLSHRARFAIPTDQDGAPVASTSEIRLYCFAGGGDWQVKYRVTAPEGVDTSVVQPFIDAGPWPMPKAA